jgi:hypothetical protein
MDNKSITEQMDFSLHVGIGIGFFSCIAAVLAALLVGEVTGAFRIFLQLG